MPIISLTKIWLDGKITRNIGGYMVTANFKYRDFISKKEIPLDITNVTFKGDPLLVENLNRLRSLVSFDNSMLADYEMGFLLQQKTENDAKISDLNQEIKDIQKKDIFMKLKKGETYNRYLDLSQQVSENLDRRTAITYRAEDLEDDRFYGQKELKERLSTMLKTLSFNCIDSKAEENGIVTQIWESSIPDPELLMVVQQKIEEMEQSLQDRKDLIKQRYEGAIEPLVEETTESSVDGM